jgi:hypothetical protein
MKFLGNPHPPAVYADHDRVGQLPLLDFLTQSLFKLIQQALAVGQFGDAA